MKIKNFLLILLSLSVCLVSSSQAGQDIVSIVAPDDAKVIRLDVAPGDKIFSGDILAITKSHDGTKTVLKAGVSGTIESINMLPYKEVTKGSILGTIKNRTNCSRCPCCSGKCGITKHCDPC